MAMLQRIVLLVFIPVVICGYSSPSVSLGSCDKTRPCEITNSLCHQDTCRCRPGYVVNESGTACSKDSSLGSCDETHPCKATGSDCVEGVCACSLVYVIDDTGKKCLKMASGYGDSCENNIQCSEFLGTGAVCQNGKCACRWGHYLHGRCHWPSKLGELCAYDDECFDGSEYQATSCKELYCKCSEGFYQRGRTACRRKQEKIGEECLLDQDCDFANGSCVEHECVQDGKPMIVNRDETVKYTLTQNDGTKIGNECKNDTDCKSIENSICDVDGVCICKRAHFPSRDKTSCVPEIGESCSPANPGLHVEHAVCREKLWTCPIDRAVSKDNRECKELVENIDELCYVDEECRLFGPKGECESNECQCKSSEYKVNKRFCWDGNKDGSEMGTYCKKDSNCDTPNSHCQNDTCACNRYFFELDGLCAAGLNAKCRGNSDCKRNHTLCNESSNTCRCEPDLVAITSDDKCLPKSQYNESCEHSLQCTTTLPNTECKFASGKKLCECLDTHYFVEGQCQPKKWVGDECTRFGECFTSNTTCTDDICECISTHIRDEDKCVRKIMGRCESNGDCNMPNSFCRHNECTCEKYYYDFHGICKAGLNGNCNNNTDCKFENMICHEPYNTCQCKPDCVDISETECLPKSRYNEKCEHEKQCYSALAHSTCTDGRCQCEAEYPDYYEEKCNLKSSSTDSRPLFSLIGLILLGLEFLL